MYDSTPKASTLPVAFPSQTTQPRSAEQTTPKTQYVSSPLSALAFFQQQRETLPRTMAPLSFIPEFLQTQAPESQPPNVPSSISSLSTQPSTTNKGRKRNHENALGDSGSSSLEQLSQKTEESSDPLKKAV